MTVTSLNQNPPISSKHSIIGVDKAVLRDFFIDHNQPVFRVTQVEKWLYNQGVSSFDAMNNLSKELRILLHESFSLSRPDIVTEQKSKDGTVKWLLKFTDGNEVETVFIPEKSRGTLCISSQVGCSLTCSFCHTGTQRMVRNLTADEIISQVLLARDRLNDWPSDKPSRQITNIVLMGMGEPLLNYDNVKQAVLTLTNPEGMSFSKRRVTLSTSGIVPNIVRIGTETGVNLAISLHATHDELRDELVPINKKYPIAVLLEACKHYPSADKNRRITFEYVMLADVNDSEEDAKRLVKLLHNIPAKVNLIPFNPWPGSQYICSKADVIERFSEILEKSGIEAPIRTPRGSDILAACGQLKSESLIKRKSQSSN